MDSNERAACQVRKFLNTPNDRFCVLHGDSQRVLSALPDRSIDLTVTSPPYFLQKDYGFDGQIGWRQDRSEYLSAIQQVLEELFRVTTETGSCFVIVADTYRKKCLQLIPQSIMLAAFEIGWTLRNELIWHKTDAPPERVNDRWRYSHEQIIFMSKRATGYRFDLDTIRIPYSDRTKKRWGNGQAYGGDKSQKEASAKGQRFRRGKTFKLNAKGAIPPDVLAYATSRSNLAHYATYPIELISKFVAATTMENDIVLDPFVGSGTTAEAAITNGRRFLGIDGNQNYVNMAIDRCEMKSDEKVVE